MAITSRRMQRVAHSAPPPPGDNLLVGKVFSSSVADSTSEPGHPIAYTTDQDTGTRWISQPTSPVTLTADLEAVYDLSRLHIIWAGNTIRNFQIQVSMDNSTWTTIVSGETNNTPTQTADYTSFSGAPRGQYLRIVGVDRWNASFGNSIWEVEAYGSYVSPGSANGTLSGFAATPNGSTGMNLIWSYSGSTLSGLTLRRDGTVIQTLAGTATSYSDSGLSANTTYNYSLQGTYALNGQGTNTVSASGTTAGSSGPQLPALGFSLNGESLSGPLQQSHYNNLGNITPGTVWARLGFSSDGNWQSSVDMYVGAARAAGMNILLRASFPNAVWSGTQPLDAGAQAAYGDFVRDLALYAKNTLGLSANDVVFEHPNEMNGRVTGAAYTGAAANAYPKLKGVDPNYKIIGASENVYAGNWQTWLQDVYAAGYASAADGVSFHNYDAQGDDSKYTFLENLMKAYDHWPAMVWLSEFGSTTPPGASGNGSPGAGIGGQTEQGQATRITGVLEHLRDELPWISHAFIYADEDIPSRKSSDPFEAYFGIYRNDTSGNITGEKPAVDAIRQLYLAE